MTVLDGSDDEEQRKRALDPARSFIVQAPAGSGKTELLIQRYLRLLTTVDEPEEVLAITFTLKAAGEMRGRIVSALRAAELPSQDLPVHLRLSHELARQVLDDPRRGDWQLLRHPARLRISTIDAVNAWLASRAPLSAGSSATRTVTDTPEILYQEAARATLALLGQGGDLADHVAVVLRHVDNDTERFERLIVNMLPKREQWLRQVLAAGGDRKVMEAPLRELTAHILRAAAGCLDKELKAELRSLLDFAARQLKATDPAAALVAWEQVSEFPAADPAQLSLWRALTDALLTAAGGFRRRVDKRSGFPPGCPEKDRFLQLLVDCAARPGLLERLLDVRSLPGTTYERGQWEVLQSLLEVLKLAAAQLQLVFARRSATDFAEVAADALQALGEPLAPSGLGLALDHRIRHILVDEFQDTSLSQFQLLHRLTEGWSPGDGRTIFLVGDPMQSIYRFRQAEVGIFMRVRDDGIGSLRPEFVRLAANFRSVPGVIDWVNRVFGRTFPDHDDALLGTVRYAASQAQRRPRAGTSSGVVVHWLGGDDRAEAREVVRIVSEKARESPDQRICILVRSRSHAAEILAAMRTAGVPFVAPEIENLEHSAVAQGLLALTRALLHPADRLAWIGVLRAPWCGLSLADLHSLLAVDLQRCVPELLRDAVGTGRLSEAGQRAIERLHAIAERAERRRGGVILRDLVEGAWLDLAGPATVREEAEMETARTFFELLDVVDTGGDCPDLLALGELMSSRKGSLGSGEPAVQIMTVHKAKGLEFDTVIIPGLAKAPRGDTSPLLAWQEVHVGDGRSAAILAPMDPTGEEPDPLYRYLLQLEQRKRSAEIDRLLYVACTRAREHLHLLARLDLKRDKSTGELSLRAPRSGSFLEHLWPALQGDAAGQLAELPLAENDDDDAVVWVQPRIRRLPLHWKVPASPPALHLATASEMHGPGEPVVYEWASRWAMHAGSVIHRWLQVIAEEGLGKFDATRIEQLTGLWRRQLQALGTPDEDLDKAVGRVAQGLSGAIRDDNGRWILCADHVEAECELPLTVCEGAGFRSLVIDRTFVTADGERWLIDYKTGTHEGGDLEGFLRIECERHRAQLRLYRDALAAFDCRPVRAALYFPVLGVLREIDLAADGRELSETAR